MTIAVFPLSETPEKSDILEYMDELYMAGFDWEGGKGEYCAGSNFILAKFLPSI